MSFKAYFAGLFDGEGCIIINKRKRPYGTYYYLQCHLSMTHKPVIDMLQFCYPGQVYIRDRKPGVWKKQYDWCLNSTDAYNFIKDIQPYALVKREEIDAAIAYHEYSDPSPNNPRGGCREDIEQYGEHVKQHLSDLKKREWL